VPKKILDKQVDIFGPIEDWFAPGVDLARLDAKSVAPLIS